MLQVIAIVVSLAALIYVAYRGFNVIFFAPIFALLAAAFSGHQLMPAYTELFMIKMVGFVKSFFPLFMLGAVFGKVMDETGAAKAIAHWLLQKLGPSRAILSVILTGAILTYGGVSVFVAAFAIYPFAAAFFREGNIPKRLIPGTIAAGIFTFTMTALPGTPQAQNLIPTKYFGTTGTAAPLTGFFAAVIMFAGSLLWLEWRRKKAQAAGEGYGEHTKNEPEKGIDTAALPSPFLSILPLATVLGLNFWLSKAVPQWNPALMKPYEKLPLAVTTVTGVAANWALIISVMAGILLALALNYRTIQGKVAKAINEGTMGSLLAIFNTGSEVGYGNVISTLAGFQIISNGLLSIKGSPLISEAVSVNLLAGITGSASGGMSIALEVLGKQYMEWAARANVSPEMLHRIASISSGGLDSLPHNGAVITLLAICGLTHKQSYFDIMMTTLVIPLTAGIASIILYAITGIA